MRSYIWNVSYIELQISKSSELWSSQLCNCPYRSLKKTGLGVWTHDLAISMRDSLTNWDMKPLTLGGGHLWVLMNPWGMYVKLYMKYFIYNFTFIPHKWPSPNVSGCIASLMVQKKQMVNYDSNKQRSGFSLISALAMLKMFNETFSQNSLLPFPGRLIFGIAKPF